MNEKIWPHNDQDYHSFSALLYNAIDSSWKVFALHWYGSDIHHRRKMARQ
ncbi:hypothetical protein NTE_00975 [Candidatus Nitrososphaera evergladensis SR1]|uniref:Uncharacterized protein n=1 Tax=Candidatus Nitrososphaera evergladensis SR1 TaxID=1459636 RepID=A0A075MPI5_9ARCH|nr:hypothetical protein [Candidatus Nitrososphaera evergladensis]AIF83050.1 hypothetical protein NTE_00975 [Candidatus Nitrososphaera evergladensis SR1]